MEISRMTVLHNILILSYDKLCTAYFQIYFSVIRRPPASALIFSHDFYNFDITDASASVKYTLKVSFIVLLGRCDATACPRIHVCATRSNSNHVYAITPRWLGLFSKFHPPLSSIVQSALPCSASRCYDYFFFSFRRFFLKRAREHRCAR